MVTPQKAEPLLRILLKVQRKYKKHYSFPSQLKIMELLERFAGYTKSRATINRWLRVIEDEGYLKRTRRIRTTPEHGLEFNSTMYSITLKGLYCLRRALVGVEREINALISRLTEKYPDLQAQSTKIMLADAKPNPQHSEHIQKILTGLADNLSIDRA